MAYIKKALFVAILALVTYKYMTQPRPFDASSVKGKVVVVTGASSGIGEEVAYQYASHGCRLILAARREERLKEVKKRCMQLGSPETYYIVTDFSKYNDSLKLYEETLRLFDGVDILILNHGIALNKPWHKDLLSEQILQQFASTNVLSFITLATLFTSDLVKHSGSIGVVSSAAGVAMLPNETLYTSTKYAINGFFDTYRAELSLQNIRNISITVFVFGPVATSMMKELTARNATHFYNIPIIRAEEAAISIIHGIAQRVPRVYVPWYLLYTHYLYVFAPQALFWVHPIDN